MNDNDRHERGDYFIFTTSNFKRTNPKEVLQRAAGNEDHKKSAYNGGPKRWIIPGENGFQGARQIDSIDTSTTTKVQKSWRRFVLHGENTLFDKPRITRANKVCPARRIRPFTSSARLCREEPLIEHDQKKLSSTEPNYKMCQPINSSPWMFWQISSY